MRIELAFPMTAREIASACGASLSESDDRVIEAITTDSRLVRPGDMFIALCGTHSDGHLFLPEARARGASLLVSQNRSEGCLSVKNTRGALRAIAAHYLKAHRIPVVAITGSVGKTGTKDAIAAALSPRFCVHKTIENLNNELGVSFTLLSRPKEAEIAVLEFGTNANGEIATLARCAPPDIAVLTAIGRAHIGAFGSREAIFREKASLLTEMQDGLAVLNGDDPLLASLAPSIPTLRVGLSEGLSLTARRISYSRYGTSYTLDGDGDGCRIFLRSVGSPHIYASLFAIAVSGHFGVPLSAARDALFRMPYAKGRQTVSDAGGVLLIDDSYNASPESMVAALELLSRLGRGHRRIAVLGDMLELGTAATALHAELGRESACCTDLLFSFGQYAEDIARGAIEGGMQECDIRTLHSADLCRRALLPILTDGDTVLIKASHALGGHSIAEAIRARG